MANIETHTDVMVKTKENISCNKKKSAALEKAILRSGPFVKDDYFKQGLIPPKHDLKVVEHELTLVGVKIIRHLVYFYCQEAVEKYLKAFLVDITLHVFLEQITLNSCYNNVLKLIK